MVLSCPILHLLQTYQRTSIFIDYYYVYGMLSL